jgi:hypothetical protein
MTTENGAVTAGTNGRVKGKRRTTTIRIAMQPPIQVASVRGVSVLVTPRRPAYFWRFRNSSIALRISQETGRSSRTEIFSSFASCSGFSRMEVSFFITVIHYTTMPYDLATRTLIPAYFVDLPFVNMSRDLLISLLAF